MNDELSFSSKNNVDSFVSLYRRKNGNFYFDYSCFVNNDGIIISGPSSGLPLDGFASSYEDFIMEGEEVCDSDYLYIKDNIPNCNVLKNLVNEVSSTLENGVNVLTPKMVIEMFVMLLMNDSAQKYISGKNIKKYLPAENYKLNDANIYFGENIILPTELYHYVYAFFGYFRQYPETFIINSVDKDFLCVTLCDKDKFDKQEFSDELTKKLMYIRNAKYYPKKIMTQENKKITKDDVKSKEEVDPEVEKQNNREKIKEIIVNNSKKFVGQEETITRLALDFFYNINMLDRGNPELYTRSKHTILLDGPTGTGKTAILKSLSKDLNVPIVVRSTKQYSTTGYKGQNLTDILVDLLDAANGDLSAAEKGIVCLDEFDKLMSEGFGDKSSFNEGLQNELLQYLSGNSYTIDYHGKTVSFNTSGLTFVFAGAFTKLRETTTNPIGFLADVKPIVSSQGIKRTDMINAGLAKELVGRINSFAHTKPYTAEDLYKILVESTISPLKDMVEIFKENGCVVTYTEDFLEGISLIAEKKDSGARGLQEVVTEVTNMMLPKVVLEGIGTVELDSSVLKNIVGSEVLENNDGGRK